MASHRLLFCLLLVASDGLAHDLWVERSGDSYELYQGHRYSAHRGEERVPYLPEIVKKSLCVTAQGVRSLPPPSLYPAKFPGPCALLLVETTSGYWSQTLTETANKPKTQMSGRVIRSWLSLETLKLVEGWSPGFAAPIGQGLELVPLRDPLSLRSGEKLPLLATWRGAPKAGVAVAYDGSTRGSTGSDGKINIRVRHGGHQVISGSFEQPVNDPSADRAIHTTTLQFRLEHDRR